MADTHEAKLVADKHEGVPPVGAFVTVANLESRTARAARSSRAWARVRLAVSGTCPRAATFGMISVICAQNSMSRRSWSTWSASSMEVFRSGNFSGASSGGGGMGVEEFTNVQALRAW